MTHNQPEAHIAFEGKKISDDLTHGNYAGAHTEIMKEMHSHPNEFGKLLKATNTDLQHSHQHQLSVSYDGKHNVSHIDFNKHQIYNHAQSAGHDGHKTNPTEQTHLHPSHRKLGQQAADTSKVEPHTDHAKTIDFAPDITPRQAEPVKGDGVNLPDRPSNGQDQGVPRTSADWKGSHDANVRNAHSSKADTVYYGDSITAGMPVTSGKFGINSDSTDNLRYRLNHGEADLAKQPQNAVLHIGVNDLGGKTPEAIAKDILADAKLLHQKLPDSKLLVVGLMSRPGFESQISQINALVKDGLDKSGDPAFKFADLRSSMQGLYRDGVHPTYPDPKHPERRSGYVQMLSEIKKALN